MSSFSVAYLHLGQNLYLNFRGLLGLKSNYRSGNKESSGSRSLEDWALTYCMTISHGKWLQFPQAIRVNPFKHQKRDTSGVGNVAATKCGEATSTEIVQVSAAQQNRLIRR